MRESEDGSDKKNIKKRVFRKSSSCEPNVVADSEMDSNHHKNRKKSFTTFFSNLFGTKIPENRNSGISTQSSSYESVNTILSSNSFAFVNPKKYKGKHRRGKRIPVPTDDDQQQPMKPRRIGTLTRIGMKIGLKSKYNLQSCESLHHVPHVETATLVAHRPIVNSNTGGTLISTSTTTLHRKKRQAPAVPLQLPSSSASVPSCSSSSLQPTSRVQSAVDKTHDATNTRGTLTSISTTTLHRKKRQAPAVPLQLPSSSATVPLCSSSSIQPNSRAEKVQSPVDKTHDDTTKHDPGTPAVVTPTMKESSPSPSSSTMSVSSPISVPSSPGSPSEGVASSPSKISPRPWYKRNHNSSPSKTKQLIKPLSNMTKFSDIDREASRIVEERRSAEQCRSETTRKLIVLFNEFNQSQRETTSTTVSENSSRDNSTISLPLCSPSTSSLPTPTITSSSPKTSSLPTPTITSSSPSTSSLLTPTIKLPWCSPSTSSLPTPTITSSSPSTSSLLTPTIKLPWCSPSTSSFRQCYFLPSPISTTSKSCTQNKENDKQGQVTLVPPCENFIGAQLPSSTSTKQTPSANATVPVKSLIDKNNRLDDYFDLGDEVDIVKLRQARLAFFDKINLDSSSTNEDQKEEKDYCASSQIKNPLEQEGRVDQRPETNNLAIDNNHSYNINYNNNIQGDAKEKVGKKCLNVFTDDEDDSIDALLQIPNIKSINTAPSVTKSPPQKITYHDDDNISNNNVNMPNFSGPRTWNPLHSNKFRPILESILEASSDIYMRIDTPIYENWNMSQCKVVNENNNSSSIILDDDDDNNNDSRRWANTFMQSHQFHHSVQNNYANSNSDSSSCSEYDLSSMDGKNRAPSRRHSSHHHHNSRNGIDGQHSEPPTKLPMTLEDYRKLGAIPKYWREDDHQEDGASGSSQTRKNEQHRLRTSHNDKKNFPELSTESSTAGYKCNLSETSCYTNNTAAVRKLLRKLEWAIAVGERSLAATLASELAVLKINCVVAEGGNDQQSSPITIRVYVEDRFMQQGPFHVQITRQMTVKELKTKIEKDWEIPIVFQKWILGRKIAEDDKQTLSEFDVVHDSMAFLYLVSPQMDDNLQSSGIPSVNSPSQEPSSTNKVTGPPIPLPLQTKKNIPINSKSLHENYDDAMKSSVVNAVKTELVNTVVPSVSPPLLQTNKNVQVKPKPTKDAVKKVNKDIVTTTSATLITVNQPLPTTKNLQINPKPTNEHTDKLPASTTVNIPTVNQSVSPLVNPPSPKLKPANPINGTVTKPAAIVTKDENVARPLSPPLRTKKNARDKSKAINESSGCQTKSTTDTAKKEDVLASGSSPPPLPKKKTLPVSPKPTNEHKDAATKALTIITKANLPLPIAGSPPPLPIKSESTNKINDTAIKPARTVEIQNVSPRISPPPQMKEDVPDNSKLKIDDTDTILNSTSMLTNDEPITELKTVATASPPPLDNMKTYQQMVQIMEQSDVIRNVEQFECPVCFTVVKENEGVILRDCLHSFCKDCLIGSIQHAEDPEVKCPFRDDKYSCQSSIPEREIKALLSPELFEKHLSKSVKVAEGSIINTFHCKTNDCGGWCVFEDDVNQFHCPVCKKTNCLNCQAIHENMNCQEYQRQLAIESETDENAKSSRLMLEKMIQKGEALECPACHVVLLKKWGCDWVRCSYCKTEICWVTRGFRWGPGGKGDTSAGCKCAVNGVRCHPKCTYCH